MASTYEINLSIKRNGQELTSLGFPVRARLSTDEDTFLPDISKAADGNDTSFTALSIGEVDSVQAFFYQAIDQALGVRVEGGESSNTAIRLNAGGFILIFDAVGITDSNITDNNNAGAAARVKSIAAGT